MNDLQMNVLCFSDFILCLSKNTPDQSIALYKISILLKSQTLHGLK